MKPLKRGAKYISMGDSWPAGLDVKLVDIIPTSLLAEKLCVLECEGIRTTVYETDLRQMVWGGDLVER